MSLYSGLDANYILPSSPMPYCHPIPILTSLHTSEFVSQILNVGCHLPTTITEHIYSLLGIPRVLVCCILPASKAPIPNALTNTFKFIYANHAHQVGFDFQSSSFSYSCAPRPHQLPPSIRLFSTTPSPNIQHKINTSFSFLPASALVSKMISL